MRFTNLRLSMVLCLAVFALGFLVVTHARADDPPVCGAWSWFSGTEVTLESNKTIHIQGRKAGVWESGQFKYHGETYGYKLIWDKGSDGNPHVDYLNLVNNHKRLEGVNTEGAEVWGKRK